MSSFLSSIETSAGWGAGKLNHQAYGYSVSIFQNSSWIRICTHRCWIQLSMGTHDTQWYTKYEVAFKLNNGYNQLRQYYELPQITTTFKEMLRYIYYNAFLQLGPLFVI